jgi:Zn-dependent protease
VRGIKIRIHLTFLLIIPWAAYNWGLAPGRGWSGALFGIALIAVIFVFVVLHELAHSLVATLYGVRVREIELSPIGGLAKMDSMPAKPYQEFVMAVAGPLLNLAFAIPLGGLVLWMAQRGFIRSIGHLLYLLGRPSWQGFILNLFASNLLLGLFNLLPAFPMDGGRVLRSALTWGVGQRQATRWAAYVGELTAIALGLIGLFTNNLILMLIAFFVFGGARQEYRMEELQAVLGKVPVSQALITTSPILSPDDTLAAALELTMHGHPAPYAIVENGQLAGLLTPMDITSALEIYGPGIHLGDLVRRQFPTLSPADTLAQAHHLMATSGLRALPVTEGGQFLGTVTMQQINEIYGLLTAQQRRQQSSAIK